MRDGRRGRRDRAMRRGMDYAYDRRDYRGSDYEYDSRRGDRAYSEQDYERGRRDYESMGQSDMARSDYGDMRGRGRDYNYDYGYGRDYAGDYGESLTKEELEQWRKKLDREVGDEQSKHFFKKENIEQIKNIYLLRRVFRRSKYPIRRKSRTYD